jgi:hypothetical protein
MTSTLLNIRQYAAIGDTLMLAALPDQAAGSPVSHRFVSVPLKGGAAQRVISPPGADQPAELKALWIAMHQEFGTVLPPQPVAAGVASPAVAGNQQTVAPSVTK